MGNYGQQKLLYPESGPLGGNLKALPTSWLKPGLSNADLLGSGGLVPADGQVLSLVPPPVAFEPGTDEARLLDQIVNDYLKGSSPPTGSQAGKSRGKDEVVKILQKSAKPSPPGSIAYPRLIRRNASAYLLTERAYISTNFGVIEPPPTGSDLMNGVVLYAWLRSPFSIVNRFVVDKNHEGASKVEMGGIRSLRVPAIGAVPASLAREIEEALKGAPFLDLQNPIASDADQLLAAALWGEKGTVATQEAIDVVADVYLDRQT
jgi:hypothetical protein